MRCGRGGTSSTQARHRPGATPVACAPFVQFVDHLLSFAGPCLANKYESWSRRRVDEITRSGGINSRGCAKGHVGHQGACQTSARLQSQARQRLPARADFERGFVRCAGRAERCLRCTLCAAETGDCNPRGERTRTVLAERPLDEDAGIECKIDDVDMPVRRTGANEPGGSASAPIEQHPLRDCIDAAVPLLPAELGNQQRAVATAEADHGATRVVGIAGHTVDRGKLSIVASADRLPEPQAQTQIREDRRPVAVALRKVDPNAEGRWINATIRLLILLSVDLFTPVDHRPHSAILHSKLRAAVAEAAVLSAACFTRYISAPASLSRSAILRIAVSPTTTPMLAVTGETGRHIGRHSGVRCRGCRNRLAAIMIDEGQDDGAESERRSEQNRASHGLCRVAATFLPSCA